MPRKIKILPVLITLGALVWILYANFSDYSFDELMGKGTKYWKEGKNAIDRTDIAKYKSLYTKGKRALSSSGKETKIPKLIHFIWVGPKPFPEESKQNIQSWMAKNPHWEFYFWTDTDRECPVAGMQRRLLKDFHFTALEECFHRSTNYGEKSDIWRFEILNQMGGLYLDHDVACFRSLDDLHEHFDFYVPLERPHTTTGLDQRIVPAICVIASKPAHPILQEAIQLVKSRWDEVDREFADNPTLKVVHHTFKSFLQAVNMHIGKEGTADFVLPAASFFAEEIFSKKKLKALQKKGYLFGQHEWAGKWLDYDKKALENTPERKREAKLKRLAQKTKDTIAQLYRINAVLLTLNSLLSFFIFRKINRVNRSKSG